VAGACRDRSGCGKGRYRKIDRRKILKGAEASKFQFRKEPSLMLSCSHLARQVLLNRWIWLFAGVFSIHAHAADSQIFVNSVPLSADAVRQLQRIYPVPIKPGRYWYDAVSGAWGWEGEPIAGQMAPGLKLGGPLRADASRGTSGIFINGRQIT